uniref:Odorant receptor n=1 Tax=Apriona germarii TaxID=157307 RepID=A0A7H9SP02_APRGE|nr:odorant receptor 8 [Apriona germarii]
MASPFLQYVQYPMMISGFLPVALTESHKRLYTMYRYILRTFIFFFAFFLFGATPEFNASRDELFQFFNERIMFIIVYMKIIMCMSKNLEKLIFEMIANETKISYSKNRKLTEIYRQTVRKSKIIQLSYIALVYICYVLLMLPNFVTYVQIKVAESKANSTVNIYLTKSYYCWVPIEEDKHYLFLLLLENGFSLLSSNVYCSVQIILINLLLNMTLRLKVLGSNLKNMNNSGKRIVEKLITGYIEEHIDIIRNCEFLNDTLKYLMLLEFLLTTVQLSMLMFQGITTKDLNVKVFSAMYVLQLLVQLLILYWYAHQIRVESIAIADAVYEMPWYEYNRSTAITLRIMMMRSQKPLSLTLGSFGIMTLDTAVKIIKGSYTYVTFMQQTYGNID